MKRYYPIHNRSNHKRNFDTQTLKLIDKTKRKLKDFLKILDESLE